MADSDEEEAVGGLGIALGGDDEESEHDAAALDGDTRIEPDGADTGASRSMSTDKASTGACAAEAATPVEEASTATDMEAGAATHEDDFSAAAAERNA